MIHKDYLEEALKKFVQSITKPLCHACIDHDISSLDEVDEAIGTLLDLNKDVALSLSPQSLVTMMQLSGIGADVSHEIAFVLRKEALVYDHADEDDLCCLRMDQAEAIEEAFDCDGRLVPFRLEELAHKLDL